MMEAKESSDRPGRNREVLGREAAAFMLDLGICPGASCPIATSGCDPRCPALRAWIEDVCNG
jgi:hypothetical protein